MEKYINWFLVMFSEFHCFKNSMLKSIKPPVFKVRVPITGHHGDQNGDTFE